MTNALLAGNQQIELFLASVAAATQQSIAQSLDLVTESLEVQIAAEVVKAQADAIKRNAERQSASEINQLIAEVTRTIIPLYEDFATDICRHVSVIVNHTIQTGGR